MLDYFRAAFLYYGRHYRFVESSKNMSWRFVALHFALVTGIVFIPIIYLLFSTQPYDMYARVFGVNFDDMEIFLSGTLDEIRRGFTVVDGYVIFHEANILLHAPAFFFDVENMPYTTRELFSKIAMYNMYITEFLLPLTLVAIVVLAVLQVFFIAVSAYFLGAYRLKSSNFSYGERVKIVILSLLPMAFACAAVGFFLPAVHVILFQMLSLPVIFYISKRYDLREKEMLAVM